jgi:hypothetical protein
MTSPAKTSAAVGWAESAERVADPVSFVLAEVFGPPTREELATDLRFARARVCDVEAVINEMEGRPMAAAHSRAMARWHRTQDPQDSRRAGALYVSMAAEDCILRGADPSIYTHRTEEIAAEVARVAPGRKP